MCAQFLVVAYIHADRARLGFVQNLRRVQLHNDRIPDLLRRCERLLRAVGERIGCDRNSVRLENIEGVLADNAVAPLGAHVFDNLRHLLPVHPEGGDFPLFPLEVPAVSVDRLQRLGDRFGEDVDGYSVLDQKFHPLRTETESHETDEERLVGLLLRLENRARHIHLVDRDRLHKNRDDRVVRLIATDRVERQSELFAPRARDQVERVVHRHFGGEELLQRPLDLRRKGSEVHVQARQRVGGENAGTAGVGHDRNAIPLRHRLIGERHRDIVQLLDRCRSHDAALGEESIHADVETGQRAGVGRSRLRPLHGPSRLHGDDRLRTRHLPRYLGEPERVAEVFDVHQDHAGLLVILPVLQ